MLWDGFSLRLGFRRSGLIGPDADKESDDNPTEEDSLLNVPPGLEQLFNSDTEERRNLIMRHCLFCESDVLYALI